MAEKLKWISKEATQLCCDYVYNSGIYARTYGIHNVYARGVIQVRANYVEKNR
tara:strand:+ start:582 stop:740 length:159 start_codon:yes stop_codon:yes gene_type:complete